MDGMSCFLQSVVIDALEINIRGSKSLETTPQPPELVGISDMVVVIFLLSSCFTTCGSCSSWWTDISHLFLRQIIFIGVALGRFLQLEGVFVRGWVILQVFPG